ncbi:MAG: hypothetical protein AAF297_12635 [Planctomycetota bacterium]
MGSAGLWLARGLVIALVVSVCGAQVSRSPAGGDQSEGGSADRVVEAYLARMGLDRVLAEQLRRRLEDSSGDEKIELAERLGGIYARLLGDARADSERQELERLSRELLASVPAAGSYDLRVNLAKARYLPAERVAERHRLRLVNADEAASAQATLEALARELRQLSGQLTLEIRRLEGLVQGGSVNIDELRERLVDRRRLRALASYYAGWSSAYVAGMSGRADAARDGLRSFGVILNADVGQSPSLERLPRALLRREPVARAALGVAVCLAVVGRGEDAVDWLEELRSNTEVPEAVRDQVFDRMIEVLATEARWNDLDLIVTEARNGGSIRTIVGEAAEPLEVDEARLLAIVVLEQIAGVDPDSPVRAEAERVAAAALADLVTRGEVSHVLDLLERYGSLPLGGDGFIVRYVRGLRAYGRARDAHADSGGDAERPTSDERIQTLYIDAAELLGQAFTSDDADGFAAERGKCGLLLGLCSYYRGALVRAADRFEQLAADLGADREQATWLGLVALDAAIDASVAESASASDRHRTLVARRDALATLYVAEYPATDRAATLLLRRAETAGLGDERAAEVLLAVAPGSPLYPTARRQAEARLYRVVRRAAGEERQRQATRYFAVAQAVLDEDRAEAIGASSIAQAERVFESASLRARRVLDIAFTGEQPDIAAAERAIRVLEDIAGRTGVEMSEATRRDLAFRRLQLASARGDEDEVEVVLAQLESQGDRAAESAVRFLYNRALRAAETAPDDRDSTIELVRRGEAVLAAAESGGRTSAAEMNAVRHRIASAAAWLWTKDGDTEMRDRALSLDQVSLQRGVATADALRRLGRLAEEAGKERLALDAWRTLSAATPAGRRPWFEARFNSIRLLARTEPARAGEALTQHLALYPEGGPNPWDDRFDDLRRELSAQADRARTAAP